MIWNGDCIVDGCERQAVNGEGRCRKHRREHLELKNTPPGPTPLPPEVRKVAKNWFGDWYA